MFREAAFELLEQVIYSYLDREFVPPVNQISRVGKFMSFLTGFWSISCC